jgi:hypothetical protein
MKPLWLLDVDGVINAVNVLSDLQGWDRHIREGTCWGDYCDGEATSHRAFGIIWSPGLIKRITALHESGDVEIRWLTTWEDKAQTEIAPLVGLPHFEVADGPMHWEDFSPDWWKLPRAKANAGHERPLIWTDDDLVSARAAHAWASDRPGLALLVAPRWDVGISPKGMDVIEDFVAEHR